MILASVIVAYACFGQLPNLSELDQVARYRLKRFGWSYVDRKPPTDVAVRVGAPLRKSPELQLVMREVDSQLGNPNKSYEKVLAAFKTRLAEKPNDSLRLFKLGYAFSEVWKLSATDGSALWFETNHRQWNEVLRWLVTLPPTGSIASRKDEESFEWLRVRFVIQAGATSQVELLPLGRALRKTDPHDFAIQRTLAFILGSQPTDAETQESISLCDEALRRPGPGWAWQSMKSYAYLTRWLRLGRKIEDIDQAIRANEEALRTLPPNAPAKPELEQLRKAMKQERSRSG